MQLDLENPSLRKFLGDQGWPVGSELCDSITKAASKPRDKMAKSDASSETLAHALRRVSRNLHVHEHLDEFVAFARAHCSTVMIASFTLVLASWFLESMRLCR